MKSFKMRMNLIFNNDLDNNKSQIKPINYTKATKNDFELAKIIKEKNYLKMII